ncbi:exodeoxyribonuclease VII large subunit [Salinispirillum sp. LH 10-3-1]|uniref:Exodeoxyribonuclease 7 large subunit n=1 Tax=Salinispirillum sp. LH 10-3-1 TaxID=2952525 RepID=A0AB38YDM5_9GAMM
MEQAISVAQLNRQAKFILEQHFGSVLIHGEISNLARPQSGHLYFTLKDDSAQVRCAFFKGQAMRQQYRPKDGEAVLVSGKLSLFEGRGDYQVIVSAIQPAGAGALQLEFNALKSRLEAEGLFAPERKRPIPTDAQVVGVVTSGSGAAVQDILQVLARRDPFIEVRLFPCLVQGKDAAADIRRALKAAIADGQCDVLIVGRGGGSLEDLWCFNDEALARDIAASPLPIISAVGHETDFTIADFVADLRAPTPSAAAELASADHSQRASRLHQLARQLTHNLQRQLNQHRQALHFLQQRLRHPADRIREQQQRLDDLSARLERSMTQTLERPALRLEVFQQRLQRSAPSVRLQEQRRQLNQWQQRLHSSVRANLHQWRQSIAKTAHNLHTASPMATLHRGYGILLTDDAKVVRSVTQVQIGQQISHRLADGTIVSEVKRINEQETPSDA